MHWLVEHGPGIGDVTLVTNVANEKALAVGTPKNDSRELRIGYLHQRDPRALDGDPSASGGRRFLHGLSAIHARHGVCMRGTMNGLKLAKTNGVVLFEYEFI